MLAQSWEVVIERGFRMTNQMLSDLRAAGYARGYAEAKLKQGSWSKRYFVHDLFNEEVRDIRCVVALRFRPLAVARAGGRVDVTALFHGFDKHDPDAGCLVTKAIVDGLVDAGFVAKDRFDVRRVASEVVRGRRPGNMTAQRGVSILVTEVDHA